MDRRGILSTVGLIMLIVIVIAVGFTVGLAIFL
jgi:flagellin-like protein